MSDTIRRWSLQISPIVIPLLFVKSSGRKRLEEMSCE